MCVCGGGGILEHLGFGLSDNFHWGVFWDTLDLDSMTIFILGGVFSDTLDLDSLTIFIGGGGILYQVTTE